jgi:hypothetical protein
MQTEETMTETPPMAMCPMAKTCTGMMEKTSFGAFLMVPGLLFIALGVLIIFVPQALVWLTAAASILLGVALLLLANFLRGVRARHGRGEG